MIAPTTDFDLFPASEMNRVSRYRFWDVEHANDHEKA